MQLGGNVRNCIEVHPLKENVNVEYLWEWIRNVQELIKNNVTYNGNDIRKYLEI